MTKVNIKLSKVYVTYFDKIVSETWYSRSNNYPYYFPNWLLFFTRRKLSFTYNYWQQQIHSQDWHGTHRLSTSKSGYKCSSDKDNILLNLPTTSNANMIYWDQCSLMLSHLSNDQLNYNWPVILQKIPCPSRSVETI